MVSKTSLSTFALQSCLSQDPSNSPPSRPMSAPLTSRVWTLLLFLLIPLWIRNSTTSWPLQARLTLIITSLISVSSFAGSRSREVSCLLTYLAKLC